MTRDVLEGLAAAAAGVLAMVAAAGAGLLLLDAGRLGDLGALTAAVVALAAGVTADVHATGGGALPVAVDGAVDAMPLGVSLAGAVVLGALLLRRGSRGLAVRSAVAVVAAPAAMAATARLARGTVTLDLPGRPGAVEVAYSVPAGPAVVAAVAWVLAVVAVCWLAVRVPAVAAVLRALLWAWGGLTLVCLPAAAAFGGAAAGAVVLALPLAVCGAVMAGLGVPWTMRSEGLLARALDTAPSVPPRGLLMVVAGAILLAGALVPAARRVGGPGGPVRRAAGLAVRLAPVTGALLVVASLLGRITVRAGVDAYGFSLTLIDAQLAADPLRAGLTGVLAGAVAGCAASLLTDAALLSWPAWNDRVAR